MSSLPCEGRVAAMFNTIQDEKLPSVALYEDVKRLSEPDQTVLLIQYCDGEVMNGGLHNWLSLETGAFVEETLLAMKRIGAQISTAVIENVREVFSGQLIELNSAARHKQLESLNNDQRVKLDELSDIYCVKGREQDSIFERVVKYVEDQRTQLQE